MKKKIWQEKIKIVAKQKISARYFKLLLGPSKITSQALPGQFVEIKVSDTMDPLLRRPLGIHRVGHKLFEVLFEVVGKGTEILSQRKQGEYLDIIGPLGNGFNLTPNTYNPTPILVAGGMGVAPLVFLAERFRKLQIPNSKLQTQVFIGAKTKSEILCEGEFRQLGCEVEIATDDGSKGFAGKITGLLKHLLSTIDYRLSTIYACGPKPMLNELSKISQAYKISTQISLEAHLSCGIGACLGCVVSTKAGQQRICQEGPVFNAAEIAWE